MIALAERPPASTGSMTARNPVWNSVLPARANPSPQIYPDQPGSAISRYNTCESRGDVLSGYIETASLGQIRICQIKAKPHLNQRLHALESYAWAPFLKIVFQKTGVVYLQQGERRTIIDGGRWSVYDASRPYSVQNVEEMDQLAILIPRDIKSPEVELGVSLVPEKSMALSGMSTILFQAAQSALAEADSVSEAMREALGDGILELAKLALFDQLGGAARIPMMDTFREKAKRFVLRNLADNELSVDSVATAMNCSKRYLHKSFAESGATLTQFIWTERLDRARRDLACETLANRSITEIAFNWGFVNSAHFSRRFHMRYGMTPREYRRQALR